MLNNFFDGTKQDALDLLTGTYTVSKGAPDYSCQCLYLQCPAPPKGMTLLLLLYACAATNFHPQGWQASGEHQHSLAISQALYEFVRGCIALDVGSACHALLALACDGGKRLLRHAYGGNPA